MIIHFFTNNKKCLWNMYAPPKLGCHCVLDLRPTNPKLNRGHLLVLTNHQTMLEDPWTIRSLVIDRTRLVYGRTDRPTCAKQYTPSSSKGGIIMYRESWLWPYVGLETMTPGLKGRHLNHYTTILLEQTFITQTWEICRQKMIIVYSPCQPIE